MGELEDYIFFFYEYNDIKGRKYLKVKMLLKKLVVVWVVNIKEL